MNLKNCALLLYINQLSSFFTNSLLIQFSANESFVWVRRVNKHVTWQRERTRTIWRCVFLRLIFKYSLLYTTKLKIHKTTPFFYWFILPCNPWETLKIFSKKNSLMQVLSKKMFYDYEFFSCIIKLISDSLFLLFSYKFCDTFYDCKRNVKQVKYKTNMKPYNSWSIIARQHE